MAYVFEDEIEKKPEQQGGGRFVFEDEMNAVKAIQPSQPAESSVPEWGSKYPNLYGVAGAARETLGPVIEALGLAGGATLATGAAIPTGPGAIAAGVAGGGLGYAGAKNLLEQIDVALGNAKDKGLSEQVRELPGEVATGAAIQASGDLAGPVISGTGKFIGKGIRQALGATTGAGPGAVEEAVKGGKAFTSAMRGKVTGDEIVDNVRGALGTLKEQRAAAYQEALSKIEAKKGSLDISPIRAKIDTLMKRYGVKVNSDGTIDTSRIAMGKTGRKDIEDVIDTVSQWGKQKGDRTPLGLDTLKRQLDDFYSDSGQARSFVTDLRNEVKNVIVKNVPEYAEMTKGYSEATKLIKDVEAGLMLRKQGMTGRVTADATLRRLTSAMRENFELRKDLLNVLGKQSGEDLTGQVAGYAMSDLVPRGLVGKALGSGAGYLAYINPKLWPILSASSPRMVGEFLNAYGKAMKSGVVAGTKKALPALSEDAAFSYNTKTQNTGFRMPEMVVPAEASEKKNKMNALNYRR